MKVKELKPGKEDKIDLLEWKLRIENISMKDDGVDETRWNKRRVKKRCKMIIMI